MKGVAEPEGQASDAKHGPHVWRFVQLGDISTVSAGGTPSRTSSSYWNGDIPWVTTSEVDFCRIDGASESITNDGLKNSAAKLLPAGTLLIALYGQGKTRGKTAMLGIAAATNQACAAITLHADVSREFIFYSLVSQYERIRGLSNTGNQENLNGSLVRSIPVLLPPSEEQDAIARALTDVDALLAGLDRLIAKKRDLKQAAMQQLLTGQTSLPGFESEWAEVRLGDLGTVYGGITGKTKADFGVGTDRYVTFVNVMSNVTIDHGRFEHVQVGPMESQNLVKSGDLLFNGSSETPEEVAMCSLVSGEIQGRLFLNSFCFGFRLHSAAETDALFLTYYLRGREGRELMKSLAQGSTRYNLSKSALLDSVLHLPNKAEQAAIAAVLGEMDAEFSALKAQHQKTQTLKQAMMQELLTGRIRLV